MSISLGQAWQDLNKTSQKWMTILWLCVCNLIPIAGPMVMMGYLFRRFARVRTLGEEEDFNIDHFMDYLWAGLHPFLVGMVASLILMIPLMIFMMVFMFGFVAAAQGTGSGAVFGIGMLLFYVFLFLAMAMFYMILIPMQLRAGFEQQFGAGFNMAFVKSFVAKEGFSLLKWYLLLSLIAIPAMFLGFCAFFVGAYVVIAVFTFVTWHIVFQHYDDFIAKGGEAVPFADELVYGKSVVEAPPGPPPMAAG